MAVDSPRQTARRQEIYRDARQSAARRCHVGNVELRVAARMKPAQVQYTSGESYLLRAARFADPSQTPDMNSRAQASMLELHRSLSGHDADAETPAAASTLARLRLAGFDAGKSARGAVRRRSTPPLARAPIAPQRWPLMGLFAERHKAKAHPKPWNRSAKIRRRILLFSVVGANVSRNR